MEKYMGNKSKLLDFIYENIENEITREDNKSIFDAFSGTTNVGKYFKKNGYNVVVNDINDLSYVLGKCYIDCKKIPKFKKLIKSNSYFAGNYKKVVNTKSFSDNVHKLINENKNTVSNKFMIDNIDTDYIKLLTYLTYYSTPGDYDNSEDNNPIDSIDFLQKNYCEFGENSKYINLVYKKTIDNVLKSLLKKENRKGIECIEKFYEYPFEIKYLNKLCDYLDKNTKEYEKIKYILKKDNIVGSRKFFSIEHAKRLDIIINTIMFWNKMDLLENDEFNVLMTSVIETITIFSNTSATYQAFYKDYRANTLQPFRLIIPEIIEGDGRYNVIQGDICDVISKVKTDILYLDPPYNWRQYDSNYHLLNTVSKLNEINILEFEKNIVGASGENRVEKLNYTSFNKSATFEEQLFEIIKNSKSKIVVLSYSDSESNHKVKEIDKTIKLISDFMTDSKYFVDGSFKIIKYNRKNFESRKDNKKLNINELLFIVRKKDGVN